jgi:hypothetical protein
MNGILFALSSHDYYVQAGQLFQWDTNVAASIGGYAIGTILGSTDGITVWFNTTAANSTNPDDNATAAGWVSLFASGFQPFAGLTGGVLALTATQAARKVITLSGILTSNLAVVFPNWVAPAGRWLIINNTTGAFITTARTAAGTGVTIPQGGPSNPVEVYGDGTNLYPAVSPLSVPIDQAATPLTLAERTNTGDIFARTFNASIAPSNVTAINVFYDDGDGYLNKITPAHLAAQIALTALAGQVSAGQVPLAAVTQYAANILSSAPLTGTPTAPTAAPGSTGTQVATVGFANPGVAVNGNGICINLPSGYKVQAGTCNPNGGTAAVTFPVPFTSSVFPVAISMAGGSVQTWLPSAQPPTLSGMHVSNSGGSSFWIAVGT